MTKTFQDQKLQAVLYLMGADLGKTGIDGEAGPKTYEATKKAADKIYASMAAGMNKYEAISRVQNGDIGSRDGMRKVVMSKFDDPAFIAAALEKLKQVQPPTEDSKKAMQVVLIAAGHDPRGMVDPSTGTVTGKMSQATITALANTTADGKVDPNYKAQVIAAGAGISAESASNAVAAASRNSLGNQFASAVSGPSAAPEQPRQAIAPKVTLATSPV
jgi:uncharacterized protein YoaH (UPF0181 family)